MNRLQKKCFIASAGTHSLLALILFVGPAFFAGKTKVEETQFLELVSANLPVVDRPVHMAGGAAPTAPAPAPQPPAPIRRADPPPQRDSTPAPEPAAREEREPSLTPTRRKPAVSTTPVVRRTSSKSSSKSSNTTDQRTQQLADSRRQAAEVLRDARQTLRSGLSSGTEIDMPGSGAGEAYASYASVVRSIYEQAWIPPDDAEDNDAVTKVKVTIEHTGKVLSATIIRGCGEAVIDRSVQRTLDRVTFIRPFPDGAKDKQRTYIINFNLKAKLGLG